MGNQRETVEILQEYFSQKLGLNFSEMGEMSSISLAAESETEHVAEWIVLAGSAATWNSLRWIAP